MLRQELHELVEGLNAHGAALVYQCALKTMAIAIAKNKVEAKTKVETKVETKVKFQAMAAGNSLHPLQSAACQQVKKAPFRHLRFYPAARVPRAIQN